MRRLKKGFTLVETLIALALVGATLVVFGAAVATLPAIKTARDQNIAYHVAAKKIEELRKTPFDSLPASGSFSDPGLSNLSSSTASLVISDYEGSSDIKRVTATVSWDMLGATRDIVLETLIGESGLNPP